MTKVKTLGESRRQKMYCGMFYFISLSLKAELLMFLERVARANIFGSLITKDYLWRFMK